MIVTYTSYNTYTATLLTYIIYNTSYSTKYIK